MARLKIFAAFDAKVKTFANPFCVAHAGQALRSWEEHVNDGQSMPSKYPEDFALYELGEFDDQTGEISTSKPHNHGLATAFKKQPQAELPMKAVR